jgi:hypothetical protein
MGNAFFSMTGRLECEMDGVRYNNNIEMEIQANSLKRTEPIASMRFYLKTRDRFFETVRPRIIFQGKCEGSLRCVPERDASAGPKTRRAPKSAHIEGKRIFLCFRPHRSLRSLIPAAAGFIFKEGSNLSHLANVLRRHRVPSCIDESLWTFAKRSAGGGGRRVRAEFHCGAVARYSREVQREYRAALERYHRKIESAPLRVPVFSVSGGRFVAVRREERPKLGEKALSVNALRAGGFRVPETLILYGMNRNPERGRECDGIDAALDETFPRLESDPDFSLMIRSSLGHPRNSRKDVSGWISTRSTRTRAETRERIRKNLMCWNEIASEDPRISLTLVIQERIPAVLSGVVFTRLPWDYRSNRMICDLALGGDSDATGGKVQILLDGARCLSGPRGREALLRELTSQRRTSMPPRNDDDRIDRTLSRMLVQCALLHRSYHLPLDIEFVMTDAFQTVFTQFRHVHYM